MKKIYGALMLLLLLLLMAGCAEQKQDSFTNAFKEGKVRLVQEDIVTFLNGETASLYRWDAVGCDVYLLSDGMRLLNVRDPVGPERKIKEDTSDTADQLDDLNTKAQAAIHTYYERQGILYDLNAQVTRAYEEYLRCQKEGENYNEDRMLCQETSVTFSNRQIICFQTTVLLPQEGETVQRLSLGAAFDRETGEAMNQWELFTAPESKVRDWLIDLAAVQDPVLRKEMASALGEECIIIFPDRLEVWISADKLPSLGSEYGIVIAYDKEVLSMLEEWAKPEE